MLRKTGYRSLLLVCAFCWVISDSFALEKSEAFLVTLLDSSIKVVSPEKFMSQTSVIIENKTLTKIMGKVQKSNGEVIKFLSVPSGGTYSLEVTLQIGEELVFVPLAPAFQETPLIFGKKSYEIPPGR